jgi:hypothetical protein
MPDTIFTNQTPATDDLDFITHFLGMEFTVSADRDCVGGRAWVPASGRPPTFFWQLWQRTPDWVLLAETDLNNAAHGTPTSGTWMSFTSELFTTPGNIDLTASTSYVEGVFTDDGHFVYTSPAPGFPIGTGVLSATTGRFRNGGTQTDPPTNTSSDYFFADITVDTSAAVLPRVLAPVGAVSRAWSW